MTPRRSMKLPNGMVPTGTYQHYKGKLYLVLGVATHSETREPMVIYVPLYVQKGQAKADVTVRPAHGPEGFLTEVKKPGWNGPRFKLVNVVDGFSLDRTT